MRAQELQGQNYLHEPIQTLSTQVCVLLLLWHTFHLPSVYWPSISLAVLPSTSIIANVCLHCRLTLHSEIEYIRSYRHVSMWSMWSKLDSFDKYKHKIWRDREGTVNKSRLDRECTVNKYTLIQYTSGTGVKSWHGEIEGPAACYSCSSSIPAHRETSSCQLFNNSSVVYNLGKQIGRCWM